MKLRKILLICLICVLLLTVSLLCAVFAYMFKQTDTVEMEFVPAHVASEVVENFDGVNKSSITVKNTGNIDAYLRVRMVTYWINADNEIVPVASQMPAYTVHSDWLPLGDHTYCYVYPVAPGNTTPANLLATQMTLETSEEGYRQVVAVFAEAIQANPDNAVEEAWIVKVSDDGTLLSGS